MRVGHLRGHPLPDGGFAQHRVLPHTDFVNGAGKHSLEIACKITTEPQRPHADKTATGDILADEKTVLIDAPLPVRVIVCEGPVMPREIVSVHSRVQVVRKERKGHYGG